MAARTPVPPEGFTEFVAARSAALLRAAWLLTGEQRMAEDLLQTALATTWRRWSTVSAADNPVSYVRRILVTTYLSWWRRRWRHEYPAGRLPELPADDSDHSAGVAQRDAIRRALARLSRQQRAGVAAAVRRRPHRQQRLAACCRVADIPGRHAGHAFLSPG